MTPKSKKKAKPKALSLREYARRRSMSPEAVSKAIKTGRVRDSVVTVGGAPKIADAELADREWKARTRPRIDQPQSPTQDPASAASAAIPDYNVSRARREDAAADRERVDASLAAIDLAQRQGELVPAIDVELGWIRIITNSRNKLLGVPSRARQRDPSLTEIQIDLFTELIREALEDLAGAAS